MNSKLITSSILGMYKIKVSLFTEPFPEPNKTHKKRERKDLINSLRVVGY